MKSDVTFACVKHSRWSTRHSSWATYIAVAGILLTTGPSVWSQSAAKATPKKPAAPKTAPAAKAVPAAKPAPAATTQSKPKAAGATTAPATPAQAAKVLDLRKFPLMEGAQPASLRTLGILMYDVKAGPKQAFEFQKKELARLGFKEEPNAYVDENSAVSHFTKAGFHVAVSASSFAGDPERKGITSVSLVNDGNVDVAKLPVPSGVKPFHPGAFRAAYTTDLKVADAAAACRKLLLAAGWEPYGAVPANPSLPDSSTQYFKQNGIKLQSWISVTPVEGNKTLIQYSTELLQADIPVSPEIEDPRYTDSQKTVNFDAPLAQIDKIVAFYRERLPKQGWKATTEQPVRDDEKRTQFLIFRNDQNELMSLDLKEFSDIVRVQVSHQTAEEVAEEEKRAKAAIAAAKMAEEESKKKYPVSIPLPEGAGEVDKSGENVFEFEIASGTCVATLEEFRKHFLKEGWKEEKGTLLEEKNGNLTLKKDKLELTFSYFDIGIGDAEIRVVGSSNVVLSTGEAKVTAEKEDATSDTPKPKPGKKPAKPKVPGIPDLPPGVEVPDDVKKLLDDALKDVPKP